MYWKLQARGKETGMFKRKSTTSKTAKAAVITHAASTRGRKKRTSRASDVAAKTHAASVTHNRKHTYTHHTSESYQHYASILKAIILFLGFVLLLAILANIFVPSLETSQSDETRPSDGYSAGQPKSGEHITDQAIVLYGT